MSVREIQAVGFDLGETLMCYEGVPLNWQSLYAEALIAVWDACRCGHSLPSEDDLARGGTILAHYNTRLNPRTTEVTATRILSEVLDCWGMNSKDAAVLAERAFFGFFQQHYAVYSDTLPALRALHARGLKIGILTDVPYGMSRQFVERDIASIAAEVDTVLTSVETGYRKPSPHGFLALAAALGVPANKIVFVGNEAKDVQGANAAGMVSVLLVRESSTRKEDYDQEITISSLVELEPLLERHLV